MLFIYRFLTNFFYPFLIILIYTRSLFGKEDKSRFKEKIFSSYFSPEKNNEKKLIWVHVASLGEASSIFSLINKLNNNQKNLEFLITTVTVSAEKLVKKKIDHSMNIKHRYFPLDINFLVKNFLKKWKPDLVLFVDSEIWPNFLTEIKMNKIPLGMINGRITKRTFTKWMFISSFAKEIFGLFDLCLASSTDSENYLKKLSVKNLKFFGNIKFSENILVESIRNKNINFFNKKKFGAPQVLMKMRNYFV